MLVWMGVLWVKLILLPSIGHVQRTPASLHAGQIAKAYLSFSNAGLKGRSLEVQPGATAHAAAFILAQKAGLNDATTWFVDDDTFAPDPRPKLVISGNVETATEVSPEFAKATLSFEFAANIAVDAPPSATPVAWTRGLRFDGTWAPNSPWHGAGGRIAFLDGHVEWFEKISTASRENSLSIYPLRENGGRPTSDIREALPPGAVILSAVPKGK